MPAPVCQFYKPYHYATTIPFHSSITSDRVIRLWISSSAAGGIGQQKWVHSQSLDTEKPNLILVIDISQAYFMYTVKVRHFFIGNSRYSFFVSVIFKSLSIVVRTPICHHPPRYAPHWLFGSWSSCSNKVMPSPSVVLSIVGIICERKGILCESGAWSFHTAKAYITVIDAISITCVSNLVF